MLNADSSHIKVTAEGPNLHLHAENILRLGSGQFGDNVVAVSTFMTLCLSPIPFQSATNFLQTQDKCFRKDRPPFCLLTLAGNFKHAHIMLEAV